MTEKKFYRSRTDSMVAGVCGGLAGYFGVDSTLVRLAAVGLTLIGGSGILAYLILWFVVPLRTLDISVVDNEEPEGAASSTAPESADQEPSHAALFLGVLLVVVGFLFLVGNFISLAWFSFRKLWPLILIAVGVIIVLRGSGRKAIES